MLRYEILLLVLAFLQLTLAISSKKGLGIHHSHYLCADTWRFDGVSWWYDWKSNHQMVRKWAKCAPGSSARSGYIPMIWGKQAAYESVLWEDSDTVLGFNEPNWPKQADMSPEVAAKVWEKVEEKAGGRYLVSPAVGGCDRARPQCLKWFDEFFEACQGCRVDGVAFHSYSCDADLIMEAIKELYNRYGEREIWLTEIGCENKSSVDEIIEFMKEILPRLEASSELRAYAWYAHRHNDPALPYTSLMEPNRPVLNRLGRFYNNFGK